MNKNTLDSLQWEINSNILFQCKLDLEINVDFFLFYYVIVALIFTKRYSRRCFYPKNSRFTSERRFRSRGRILPLFCHLFFKNHFRFLSNQLITCPDFRDFFFKDVFSKQTDLEVRFFIMFYKKHLTFDFFLTQDHHDENLILLKTVHFFLNTINYIFSDKNKICVGSKVLSVSSKAASELYDLNDNNLDVSQTVNKIYCWINKNFAIIPKKIS